MTVILGWFMWNLFDFFRWKSSWSYPCGVLIKKTTMCPTSLTSKGRSHRILKFWWCMDNFGPAHDGRDDNFRSNIKTTFVRVWLNFDLGPPLSCGSDEKETKTGMNISTHKWFVVFFIINTLFLLVLLSITSFIYLFIWLCCLFWCGVKRFSAHCICSF